MNHIDDKVILITGGTGSFGHAFLKHLLKFNFREIRIFSRDELKQECMRIELSNPKVKFYIGDVRDKHSVERVAQGVDYAFHAAALKQVPSCEFFPLEAVMTNVIGSANVVDACIKNGIKKLILLGTDKAVYPVNAMGMTKALMEKVGHAAARNSGNTVIASVRYGNVMCSRGSVIPLFMQQLEQSKPLTITESAMTRFLLRMDDAVDLVLFAFEHAMPGDVFVKKAPACTVQDLAMALKNLFHSDSPIKTIGIRHGEKLFETLVSREELTSSQDCGDYFRIRMDGRDLNYNMYFTEGDSSSSELEDYTSHNTRRLSVSEVERLLLTLPEVTDRLQRQGDRVRSQKAGL